MGKSGPVLVINAGSSSIKYAVFDGDLRHVTKGSIEISTKGGAGANTAIDHGAALSQILDDLASQNLPLSTLSAAAHRVVHGGPDLTSPTRLTPDIITKIRACNTLAPLHNPHNLAAIETLVALAPDMAQYASFDTAFHASNPPVATAYAVPDQWHNSNIRRFGFHGISYQALVANFPGPLPDRLLAFHLGNGASICAIHGGKSVATTMGYSPLEGLTMGSRAGSIDAAAVLDMAERFGIDAVRETLNRQSGLIGLSAESADMRTLLNSDSPRAEFAVQHFCYWAARHAGSMIAAMGGIDAIAFTGGIGENAPVIRDHIQNQLHWTGISNQQTHIIPAREERQIAANALGNMC